MKNTLYKCKMCTNVVARQNDERPMRCPCCDMTERDFARLQEPRGPFLFEPLE